ncbi:dynamin family protein [Planococcus sp. X10-3]|uniref:dynamin family protein n=1 Tax=Planococcus sp. X10-3 TaxID=3061240 RepID=UPI003BB0A6A6
MDKREVALQGVANWIEFLNQSYLINEKDKINTLKKLGGLMSDLKEKKTILISGEFNAGKSTFINALLGEEVLVSDVTPATAMITKLTYGQEKKLLLHFKNQTVQEYGYFSLQQVTAEGDEYGEKIRKELDFIEIQLPFDLLKFYTLIDSPGLTSLFQKHSDVTDSFLEEADVAIWLFNSLNVGTASEIPWLQKLSDGSIPVYGIVNGIDRLDEDEDLDAFYEYNLRRLSPLVTQLSGISSKDILEGKLKGDQQLLEWGNLKVIDTLFTGFDNHYLSAFYNQIEKPLHDFQSLLVKEQENKKFLKKREKLVMVFEEIDSLTMKASEDLKAEYQDKQKLINDWQIFLKNNMFEPMNIEPFMSQFKNTATLRAEWDAMVMPQLRSYLERFEELQLERKLINLKKLAAEEHYSHIDEVYFKFMQAYKYVKADKEYRSKADALNRKFDFLNMDQKEVEKSIHRFTKVIEQEVKNELVPINERIKQVTLNWHKQLLPIKQAVGEWEIDGLLNMEEYVGEIKSFQRKVLPYIHLALEKQKGPHAVGNVEEILHELSNLYKEENRTHLLDRIVQMETLKEPIEQFTIRVLKNEKTFSLQKVQLLSASLDLKEEFVKLSPQLIKDPGVVAAGVALLMTIF